MQLITSNDDSLQKEKKTLLNADDAPDSPNYFSLCEHFFSLEETFKKRKKKKIGKKEKESF